MYYTCTYKYTRLLIIFFKEKTKYRIGPYLCPHYHRPIFTKVAALEGYCSSEVYFFLTLVNDAHPLTLHQSF